jgi:hypothetical protein
MYSAFITNKSIFLKFDFKLKRNSPKNINDETTIILITREINVGKTINKVLSFLYFEILII